MKNQGLRGVTDATVFCASMKKGGPKPMIASVKKYEMGGMTDDACMEEYMGSDGKRKRRRKNGCGKVTKTRSSGPTQSSYGRRMPGQ